MPERSESAGLSSSISMRVEEPVDELGVFNNAAEMGNIFQSKEFYEILRDTGWKPSVCLARGDKGDIAGSVLAFNPPVPVPVLSRFFSSTYVVFGPVLAEEQDSAALGALLGLLETKAKHSNSILVNVKVPFGESHEATFQKHGFARLSPLTADCSVLIDLSKSEEDLWKELAGRCRTAIRKAEKSEIKIAEVKTIEELHEYYKMYLTLTKRGNAYPYPFKFFESILTRLVPLNMARFFLAYYQENPVAGVTILVGNGKAMYFNGVSLFEYRNLGVNNMLIWHSICWSKDVAGARIFDLYGIPSSKEYGGEVEVGSYNFKTSFGGEIIHECAFYEKIFSSLRYHLLRLGIRMLLPLYLRLRNWRFRF